MQLIIIGLFFWICVLVGLKIAIETPEEMHLKKKIFFTIRILNLITILIFLYAIPKPKIILISFIYFLYMHYQETQLYPIFVLHNLKKSNQSSNHINSKKRYKQTTEKIYHIYPFTSYLLIFFVISYYFYFSYPNFFYLLILINLTTTILLGILEGYYLISKDNKNMKFTTETKFKRNERLKWYTHTAIRYLPYIVAYIILELLIIY